MQSKIGNGVSDEDENKESESSSDYKFPLQVKQSGKNIRKSATKRLSITGSESLEVHTIKMFAL
jgi:hypothetical protein